MKSSVLSRFHKLTSTPRKWPINPNNRCLSDVRTDSLNYYIARTSQAQIDRNSKNEPQSQN